jgi:hypothetical protein
MAKRIAALLGGTCFISLGVALLSKAAIGMSPISSFPYVLSLIFPRFSLGEWLLMWNVLFALLQIVLLNKDYKLIYLTQIPLAFLLGYSTDFAKFLMQNVVVTNYASSVLFVILGTMSTALGVYLTVCAKLIMNGPEAFLRTVSEKTNIQFGTLKSAFDISNMLLAAIVSFVVFGQIVGVREGTIFAAIFTGVFVNLYTRLIDSIKEKQMAFEAA